MPAKAVVGHFSKNDFFSVLPPGFYIFIIFYFSWGFYHNPGTSQQSLFALINTLATEINSLFSPLLLLIIFASYIFGSISRALPVSWIEQTFPLFRKKFPYFTFSRCEFPCPKHPKDAGPPCNYHFPYPDKLNVTVQAASANSRCPGRRDGAS